MPAKRAIEPTGGQQRQVHVTEIQIAMADQTARRGVYVPNTAVKDKLTKTFALLDKMRTQLMRHLHDQVDASKRWCPDKDYVDGVTKTAASQRALSSELRALEELEIAARQGLTDEQLGRVVDFQLVKRAKEMTPEQAWRFAAQRWNDAVADVLEADGRKITKAETQ